MYFEALLTPRITWEDGIERMGRQREKTPGKMRRMAENQTEWKKWVEKIT